MRLTICTHNVDDCDFVDLATVDWPAVPRVGDQLSLIGRAFGNSKSYEPVYLVVDSIVWEASETAEKSERVAGDSLFCIDVTIRVLVRESIHQAPGFVPFCDCEDGPMIGQKDVASIDGPVPPDCVDCGRKVERGMIDAKRVRVHLPDRKPNAGEPMSDEDE